MKDRLFLLNRAGTTCDAFYAGRMCENELAPQTVGSRFCLDSADMADQKRRKAKVTIDKQMTGAGAG